MIRIVLAILAGILIIAVAIAVLYGTGAISFGDDGSTQSEPVDVDDERDDDNQGDEGDEAVALGQSIYEQQCANCHSNDGSSSIGPSFQGLYGSEVTMEDGSTVIVDDEHIIESITDPRAQIRDGYPAVMPSFSDLSEDELAGIVAYIESLE